MKTVIPIGGLVAAGFDPSREYLLAITHSGRGVFSTRDWKRVARNYELAYPENTIGIGIGPLEGQRIAVPEMNFELGEMRLSSPDGSVLLTCTSSEIVIDPDCDSSKK